MKKVIALTMMIVMAVTAVVGGTYAYFTDRDAVVNTFTTGNISIDLWEDFGDNSGIEKLIPTTGKDGDGNIINAVEKEVYVTNTTTADDACYVRVHIAIPAILDDGDPNFDASKNVLHFNYSEDSLGADKWDWTSSGTDDAYAGENWNFYTVKIDGVKYNVYVVTYGAALEAGETTEDAIHQVYLDAETSQADVARINTELKSDRWKIYVYAEATQAAGFEDAYTALNTSFGIPGEYDVDKENGEWTAAYRESKDNKKYEDNDAVVTP